MIIDTVTGWLRHRDYAEQSERSIRLPNEGDPVTPNSNLGTYTNFVNLLEMCGLAVPIPARSDGRPGSITLLASSGKDALIASLSACLETVGERTLGATSWQLPQRKPVTDLLDGYAKLAVCGAHLKGLPLN